MRSKGMGLLQIAARIGATSAPWVVNSLALVRKYVPFMVLGVPLVVGAVFGMWLPETKVNKVKYPTVVDGESDTLKKIETNEF